MGPGIYGAAALSSVMMHCGQAVAADQGVKVMGTGLSQQRTQPRRVWLPQIDCSSGTPAQLWQHRSICNAVHCECALDLQSSWLSVIPEVILYCVAGCSGAG